MTLPQLQNKTGTYSQAESVLGTWSVHIIMSSIPAAPVLTELRERIQRLEGGASRKRQMLPFGVPEIDGRLPGGGLSLGSLHEDAGRGNGSVDGAAAALFIAGIAARTKGKVLWCVTRQDLFAPAIAQAGLAPSRVIYVEAGDEKTLLACFEDGLRHGGLGAVVAEVAKLSMTASRRLQLAAEGSGKAATASCAARTPLSWPCVVESRSGWSLLLVAATAGHSLPSGSFTAQAERHRRKGYDK